MKKVMFLFIFSLLVVLLSGFSQIGYATSLKDDNEFFQADLLAMEKLEQKDLLFEFIDGIEDKERFILFRGQEKGYLIYDRFTEIYLEYSVDDDSPYESIRGEKIYVAPTYCFHCGYEMSGGGIIGILKEDETEIYEKGGCCS